MNNEILVITNKINGIVQELLVPVRTQKLIDRNSFDLFYEYLEEIICEVEGEEFIPRNLTGLLFFIYTSLAGELHTNDYENPIFMEIAKIEDYLDRIYWDSPFRE